ncbi:phage minor capsid protein [Nonomuraea sp. NPDC050394]|uniref:phage minor capsid protein n=1 Tax=Nonomuraea sp. NPDC050394 TaxID=3364363 RepID=UPI003794FCB1
MAVATPQDAADVLDAVAQARLLSAMYADAEQALLDMIADRVSRQLDEPEWAIVRAAELAQLRKDTERILARLEKAMERAVQRGVTAAWRRGVTRALAELRQVGAKKAINPGQGVAELAAQTVRGIDSVHDSALRLVEDLYRKVIAEMSARVLAGAEDPRKAAARAMDIFAAHGVTGFTDERGRAWSLSSYVEMAMRTAQARAATDGHLASLRANGMDLVIVSRSAAGTCPVCAPWEGTILTQDGQPGARTEANPVTREPVEVNVAATIAQARAAGLQHPRCTHSLSAYLPGLTQPPRAAGTKAEREAAYKARQQERQLQRQARSWERRRSAAKALGDEATRKKAAAKASEYRARLKEHRASAPGPRPVAYADRPAR